MTDKEKLKELLVIVQMLIEEARCNVNILGSAARFKALHQAQDFISKWIDELES